MDLANLRKVVGGDVARVTLGANASSGVSGSSKGEDVNGEEGAGWGETGGIVSGMKSKLNVDLKDVKVPEFDVRSCPLACILGVILCRLGASRLACGPAFSESVEEESNAVKASTTFR